MKFISNLLLLVAPLTLALPAENAPRGSIGAGGRCAWKCGDLCYTLEEVKNAVSAGVSFFENNTKAGKSNYPHRFNNREGLPFPVEGPYQELPLLDSGVYNGGAPGPDRVIFTEGSKTLAGAITHTGATGNSFVSCTKS